MHKSLIDSILAQSIVANIQVAVLDPTFSKTMIAGTMSFIDRTPVTRHSRYDLASLTKLFTAIAILQSIEQETFALNTPISALLDDFTQPDITIEECLLHQTGFAPSVDKNYRSSDHAILDSIFSLQNYHPNQRGTFVYSDINFILLGLILQNQNGSLSECFTKQIFTPLRMNQSGFRPVNPDDCVPTEIEVDRGLIRGVVHDQTAFVLGGESGHAGLFSTLPDLIKFARGILVGKLVTDSTRERLLATNQFGRSLGFARYHDQYLYHTGFTGTSILLDLVNKKGQIILTNRINPTRDNIRYLNSRLQLFDDFIADPTIDIGA